MNSNKRFVLFHSNYCHYSKEVLGLITKHNLADVFMFVCVDTNRYNLPPAVDRVPIVIEMETKKVFSDEAMFQLIEALGAPTQDVQAFVSSSFADLDGMSCPGVYRSSFVSLDMEDQMSIRTPVDEAAAKESCQNSEDLDTLVAARERDIRGFMLQAPRPVG